MSNQEYKLKDVVYLIDGYEIIKTIITGVQDTIESEDKEEVEIRQYKTKTNSNSYNSRAENWTRMFDKSSGKPNFFKTLEKAKKEISDRAQAELAEKLSKVTVTDVSGS